MALENGKWRVVSGDCLWNIAASVYNNPYRWPEIANANGIPQSNPIIYPGQLFTLPGISSNITPPPSIPNTIQKKVTYNWFALDAGSERSMFATWSFDRANTGHYVIEWDYDCLDGAGYRIGSHGTSENKESSYSAPENAKIVRLSVKPVSTTYDSNNTQVHHWTDGEAEIKTYDFSNNPPLLPPSPNVVINNDNKMTITMDNIDDKINGDKIEIAIYQNDTTKYATIIGDIIMDSLFLTASCDVDPGYNYKVRCRSVRNDTIYGGWTQFTSNVKSRPISPKIINNLTPKVISEQGNKTYGVLVEWDLLSIADNYTVEWTTNIEYFDSGSNVSSSDTTTDQGSSILITDIQPGHEYFFRVASVNTAGKSKDWSEIKSIKIGTKPSAPTTYSNVVSAVIGEDLKLYWTHNPSDGSIETFARLHILVYDPLHPELEPTQITKVIPNDRPEEEQRQTNVYVINSSDQEWVFLQNGFNIKWKVQTAGIDTAYSDYSVTREANVYAKPTIELDVLNMDGATINEFNNFPIYAKVLSKPVTQTPLSYYVEVRSNNSYDTVNDTGNSKHINVGDIIYKKNYDPKINPWSFMIEFEPSSIDFENNCSYTISVSVYMNSGLNSKIEKSFLANFKDTYYDVNANVTLNKDTYDASINPFCYEYVTVDNEVQKVLSSNSVLSVYRKQYDGTYICIAKDIPNSLNTYITDPHPSLDYARYRIIAKNNQNGSISYHDTQSVKNNESAIIIQWSDKWTPFQTSESNGFIEPPWSGSLLRLPYNIEISNNNNVDVSLVNYIGRENPVSYYGEQKNESGSWKVDIPYDDKETLYMLRKLSIWNDDVYVREPSGIGYWANISIDYSTKYNDLVIPITINVRRVEGGV